MLYLNTFPIIYTRENNIPVLPISKAKASPIAFKYFVKFLFTQTPNNAMQNLAKCFSSILCLLGFLILNSTSISGQDRQAFVDSLIQHLPATKDSIYQRQLGIIGESHPNLDSSYQYIMESLALAKELDNNNSLWNSYMLLGKWYFKQGHKLKAIPFFDTASTIAQQTDNPGWLSRTLIIKGDCEVTIGKLDAAQESYSKALDICTANNFVKLNAVLQLRIG